MDRAKNILRKWRLHKNRIVSGIPKWNQMKAVLKQSYHGGKLFKRSTVLSRGWLSIFDFLSSVIWLLRTIHSPTGHKNLLPKLMLRFEQSQSAPLQSFEGTQSFCYKTVRLNMLTHLDIPSALFIYCYCILFSVIIWDKLRTFFLIKLSFWLTHHNIGKIPYTKT